MNDAPKPRPTRLRRLWRFGKRAALVLVLLAVAARIALPFVLPSILDAAVKGLELTARYEDLDLSLLSGELRIYRLVVAERPPEATADAPLTDPYLTLDYAGVDVEMTALLRGELRVRRLEVDGLDAVVERDVGGALRLAKHLAPSGAAAEPAPSVAPAATEEAPGAIDLSLPFRVDALLAQHVRLRVVDRSVDPVADTWVETSVRIADLGAPDRDARIEVVAQGPDLLDRFVVQGSFSSGGRQLHAQVDLAMRGLHPGPARFWLASLGVEPRAASLDLGAHLEVAVDPSGSDERAVDARIALTGVRLVADATEAAAIDAVTIDAKGVGPTAVHVPIIEVTGVRGQVATLPDGALLVAGLELRPRPATTAPPPRPADAPAPQTRPAAPLVLALDLLRVADVSFAFRDGSTTPPSDLELHVDEATVRDLAADPARPDAPATIALRARAPGIAESVTVDARLAPFGIRKSFHAEVRADRLTLGRIAPRLARAGLAPTLQNGTLTLRLDANTRTDADGAVRAEAAIDGLALRDGDAELFGLDQVSIGGVVAATDRVEVGEIVVRGTRVPVRLDADGGLRIAGMRTIPPAPGSTPAVAPAAPAPAAPPASPAPLPRIALGALRVRDTALTFVDGTRDPEIRASTSALELDVEGLAIGGPVQDAPANEATVRVRLRSDGVAEELGLRGTISSRPGPLDLSATLQLAGDRLAAGPFAGYLSDLGIEPVLRAGRLRATLDASARADADGVVHARARLSDVAFQDGDAEPFVALDELSVDDVALGADAVRVGTIAVTRPRLRAEREADGTLRALGLRFRPPAAAAAPAPAPAPAPTATAPAPTATAAPTPLSLAHLRITGAQIAWQDAAGVATPVVATLTVDGELADLAIRGGAAPAAFSLRARADGALDEARIDGSVTLDPADLRAQLELDARGLRAGPLSGYLPPGVTSTLTDGRLRAALDARIAQVAEGGLSVAVDLADVDFRDGEAGEPLLACAAIRVHAPRFDPAGKEITIGELTAKGATLRARRSPGDVTELLGFALSTPAPTAPLPTAAEPAAATGPAVAATAAPIDRRELPPHVVIQTLDLELERFRFEDATGTGIRAPIDARARLFAAGPLVVLDADPEALPPLELRVEATAEPIVDSVVAVLRASPWQPSPKLDASFDVTGLHGASIPDVLPSIADRVDGAELADGSFTAKLEAELDLRRRSPTDIDLSRGFGVRAQLSEIAFRARPDGEVLAGIDSVSVVAPRLAPDGSVHVAQVDVDGIHGRVRRSAAGLHVLGLTVKAPPAAEGAPAAPVAAAPSFPAARDPSPELRIDEISMRGLDFVYLDELADPPMTVPLDGLDVEVSRFSTRAFDEARAVQFSVSVTGGDVDLPKRHEAGSLISGILGAATDVVTGRGDAVELETRPMLDEIAVSGQLAFYPALAGRVRTSIAGLELTAFRGAAKEAGVELGDGVLDGGIDLDFAGTQGMDVHASLSFDSLLVSEPPGGPISTWLKLPAPLNTVLFALRDQEDRVEIPLNVHVAEGDLGMGQVTGAVVSALGSLITKAIAAAPFRITDTVTSTLGLGALFGGSEENIEQQQVTVGFGPGASFLPPAERAALRGLGELLRDDPEVGVVLLHTFGPADYQRADTLANPSPGQSRALVSRLRQRRAALDRDRAELGARARALIALGPSDELRDAVRQMQLLDREYGSTEDALDRALELLRPGAERRADQRARAMALGIGAGRLDAVRQALIDVCGETAGDRIDVRRARTNPPEGEGGGRVLAVPKRRKLG